MGERETAKERVAYWAYRGMERAAMGLPESLGRRTFVAAGRLAFRTLDGVRKTVAANQAQVLGTSPDSALARVATREAFELYARYWYDAFRIRALSRSEMNARTQMNGVERIDRALGAGHGCIVALPHMGNWDVAGHYLAVNGYRIAAVAEELRPRRLFELFLHHREELGMRIVALAKGENVGHQLARLLADNWVVALVADRDLSGRGVEVEMFGATRKLPAGPARLSLSMGAPLLICAAYTLEEGWRIEISEPIELERSGVMREDVVALTRLLAREFERGIAARPVDWHMFQPAWDR
ncbi:MAG TPA: phosphatidylinositol mannoside acyltransferase [Actinomycetota bacterium]